MPCYAIVKTLERFFCKECNSKMDIVVTPELLSKDLIKLVCPKCNKRNN